MEWVSEISVAAAYSMSINARWKIQEFADIVDLSDAEIHSIQTEIPDLPKELERHGAIVLTEGSQKSKHALNWMGSISRFALSSETLHLTSLLLLNNAQFAA